MIKSVYLRRTENWSEEQEGMIERLGEMREGRRERRLRIEKGSRERIEKEKEEKETKRQFEEKEGLRAPPPPPLLPLFFFRIFYIQPCDVAIVSSSPQGGCDKLEVKHQN